LDLPVTATINGPKEQAKKYLNTDSPPQAEEKKSPKGVGSNRHKTGPPPEGKGEWLEGGGVFKETKPGTGAPSEPKTPACSANRF